MSQLDRLLAKHAAPGTTTVLEVPTPALKVRIVPVAPGIAPPSTAGAHSYLIDATNLPDGYPGPLWWPADTADCAALALRFPHAVEWGGAGIWTDYVPPGRGVPIPASVRRVPVLPVRKAHDRWSTLWGRTARDRVSGDRLFWLLALDEFDAPTGLWVTTPDRATRLLAKVTANEDAVLPAEPEWMLHRQRVAA